MGSRRLFLRIEANGRRYALLPINVSIFLDEVDADSMRYISARILDLKTGEDVPCQISCPSDKNLNFTISLILQDETHTDFEVILSTEEGRVSYYSGILGSIKDRGDKELELYFGCEHIANYIFNEAYEKPFLYPVIGPDGLCVTREVPSLGDHPHHRGIGIALGEISDRIDKPGVNFWGVGSLGDPNQGRIIHQKFSSLEQGPVLIRITEENIWKQNDEFESNLYSERQKIRNLGKILLNETRTITIWNVSPNRIIDIQTVITPAQNEIILNKDEEMAKENGPLLVRVADNMRGSVKGMIVNSEGGMTEKECWGRRARWVDYYGPVIPGGPVNGIAILDHPGNLRHPPGWHVRDYGLFAPNIFYSKKPEWPDQGPIFLSKDDKLGLCYRIYIHHGNEEDGNVEQKWQDWAFPLKTIIQNKEV